MIQTNLENKREYGLDLLRGLSMLFVIVIHFVGHGGLGTAYPSGSVANLVVSWAEIAAYPAVDCFVLLSGYLLCCLPFKLSRIVRTWTAAFFWSVAIQSLFFCLRPETVTTGTALYMLLPVLSETYWFLNAYIVMMLVSPVLNRLLRDMPQWQLRGLLLAALAVFCVAPLLALGNDVFKTQNGYSFTWFLVLYLWGGYIRLYCPKSTVRKNWKPLLGYVVLVTGHLLWMRLTEILIPNIPVSGIFMKYTSVPVFGSALCLLQFFRSVQIPAGSRRAQFLENISPLIFGVCLIHDNPLIQEYLMKGRFCNAGQMSWEGAVLVVSGAVLGIFVLCICLEWLRSLLFRGLRLDCASDRLCRKLTDKIVRLLKGDL